MHVKKLIFFFGCQIYFEHFLDNFDTKLCKWNIFSKVTKTAGNLKTKTLSVEINEVLISSVKKVVRLSINKRNAFMHVPL